MRIFSTPDLTPDSNIRDSGLTRAVGVLGLSAAIVNVTVGGGIFRLPSIVASSLGTHAPLAYVVCAFAMGLIALCFAEAGSRVDLTGGPYAYVEVAFGPFIGFLCGVLLWLVGTLALAAVSSILLDALSSFVPMLVQPIPRGTVLVGVFAVLTIIHILGIKEGNRFNAFLTVAKLTPLIVLGVVGLFFIKQENLVSHVEQDFSGLVPSLARTSAILIFAFAGIETALIPSGEVKNNARTVPWAIAFAMLGITLLYVVLHLVAQGILGDELQRSSTPLVDTAARLFHGWGWFAVLTGMIISMFGYISGMTLAVPRAIYAFGRDGFLPKIFASVHPQYKTPHVAIIAQGVLSCALALTNGFEKLAILANLSVLIVYAACCLAAIRLRSMKIEMGGQPFRIPGGKVVPFAALTVIAWLLTSITFAEWLVVLGTVAVATAAYGVIRSGRKQ